MKNEKVTLILSLNIGSLRGRIVEQEGTRQHASVRVVLCLRVLENNLIRHKGGPLGGVLIVKNVKLLRVAAVLK